MKKFTFLVSVVLVGCAHEVTSTSGAKNRIVHEDRKPAVQSKTSGFDLKPGYYEIFSSEETRISEILHKSVYITIGYGLLDVRFGPTYKSMLTVADISDLLPKIKERELATVRQEINYDPKTNDNDFNKIISLLQANGFKTIAITEGTGNRGGTNIIKIIRN